MAIDERIKTVMVAGADQPFIEAAVKVLRARVNDAESVVLIPNRDEDGNIRVNKPEPEPSTPELRRNLYARPHPTNQFSTLPVKRAVSKNPDNLTGRQLKKLRKRERCAIKDNL